MGDGLSSRSRSPSQYFLQNWFSNLCNGITRLKIASVFFVTWNNDYDVMKLMTLLISWRHGIITLKPALRTPFYTQSLKLRETSEQTLRIGNDCARIYCLNRNYLKWIIAITVQPHLSFKTPQVLIVNLLMDSFCFSFSADEIHLLLRQNSEHGPTCNRHLMFSERKT